MTLSRRAFLSTTALAAAAGPLAACGTGSMPSDIVLQIASYADNIANGLQSFLESLASGGSDVAAATLARIKQIVAGVQSAAAAIVQAVSAAAAQPAVQQIVSYVNQLVTIAASLPLPPPIMLFVQSAAVLLPLLEQLAGLAPNSATTQNALTARAVVAQTHLFGARPGAEEPTPEVKALALLRRPPIRNLGKPRRNRAR